MTDLGKQERCVNDLTAVKYGKILMRPYNCIDAGVNALYIQDGY